MLLKFRSAVISFMFLWPLSCERLPYLKYKSNRGYSERSSLDFYIETVGNNIIIGGFITLQGNNITSPLKIQLDNKADDTYGYTPPFENSTNTDFEFMGMAIAVASSSQVIITPLQCKVENNHIIIESFDFDGNTSPTLSGNNKFLCFPTQIITE